MSFSLDVRARLSGATVVVVRGELDTPATQQFLGLIEELLKGRPAQLCIDLGLVTFADSGAVGALVHVHRRCTQIGCQLVVERLSPALQRTLETAGVLSLLRPF